VTIYHSSILLSLCLQVKRSGLWLGWPFKRGDFWWEWPYKMGDTIMRNLRSVACLGIVVDLFTRFHLYDLWDFFFKVHPTGSFSVTFWQIDNLIDLYKNDTSELTPFKNPLYFIGNHGDDLEINCLSYLQFELTWVLNFPFPLQTSNCKIIKRDYWCTGNSLNLKIILRFSLKKYCYVMCNRNNLLEI
jgi:hypothetical protein